MSSLERDRVPVARPIPVKEVPLVDRTEEMNVLKEAVYKAAHGEGGLVFVHGEAGIGKTRLLRELGAYAQSRGVQVLHGRCPGLFRMDGVPPYIIWKEVIKDYLETCIPEQLYRVIGYYPAEVAKLVPELGQKLRTIPPSFPISPEQEQNRLFEAVSQFITNLSQEIPLLVILDDLQWTDPSSLLLLHYLARGVQKTQLLLLGAYRSTDVDANHPLTPVLTELKRERLPQSVSLKRMSLEDTSEIIRHILEQDDIPPEFCKTIYEKTRGNPFFIEEVIESLKEEDIINREEGEWKFSEVSAIEFPESVKNVVKARISRLDEECQNVLTMASFVGNDFSFGALAGVTGIEESKLQEIMDKLLKTGLIKHRVVGGEDLCSFADIIVRDVEYEEVGAFKRKKIHGIVGSTLENVYAKKIDEHLGELAYHFLESGDKDKALDYFLRAGEKSQNTYAYDEAFSYLSHALKLLEEKDGSVEEKTQLTERLGDIKTWTGQFDAGTDYWNKALTMWTRLENRKSIARLHAKMAHAFWDVAGDKKKASEHHQMALKVLEKEPESADLASLYEDIGHRLWRSGTLSEAYSWLQKSVDLAGKLGDSRVLAECYNDLGALCSGSGELEKMLRYFEQGLKVALESNSLDAALRLYNNLGSAYWATGEPQKAFETYQKGLELAKKVGDLEILVWLEGSLAQCYCAMGELQQALSMLEDDLMLVKRIRNVSYSPNALLGIGMCYQWMGEWDKSLRYLTEAIDVAEKAEEYVPYAEANLQLGELFMEMGDYDEAEKHLTESNNICEKVGETTGKFFEVYPALSRLYLKKGEIEKAWGLIERTYDFAVKSKCNLLIGYAEMIEGMLFREQKMWQQSIQHFERSLQTHRALNAQKWYVPFFTDCLYEYGLMYIDRNEEGDREKAHALLNQTLEIFQKTGARKRLEKVEARIACIETGKVTKPKPIEPVSMGYADLDKLLCGGIPSNYAVVLNSLSCDERDMLIKSFLEIGAKKGEVTFHVTIDPSAVKHLAEEFPSNFYLFVCNPQANAIVGNLPNVSKLRGVENLTDISIALTSAIRKLDPSLKAPRRICIGLVSDVLLQHHAVQTRRWLAALIAELKSAGFTTLAVFDPEMHSSQDARAILGLFDGEISIYEKETEKGLEKHLKIKKMSNREYLEDELLLKKESLQKRK
ncbi:MAG TPA: tetratricopeptide repeat protein [Candidatus Bathyarchaeia archaeon]|nr:tetratricopeptide repeat protein [Candidatus Bathyarchaeia archaeon]